ncbi:TOBE domain-containing protein [Leptospira kmetyi]|uniref:TOBE domain-containing protein n=1 Tax=Leptospira kmetyi TaxID=408139 RepID=A0A2M9XTG1_9LEPT|nr:TOBE domain-containing protein [Leptospira kmetyi]AYV54667.1 TOBE domain-containing protein [Leptospira kmetyi]EQA51758.1 TOBE domain protein [Leptospira kmetyi serovar Malaysia str. Bejo-Iso9]PJZ31537.1 transporter [Leptospira kmetyi]PJZ42590.1 transporter [Leptospira kmetyi]TGK13680.1 TOBE domain-containing protein [Leptospira kmetyi]
MKFEFRSFAILIALLSFGVSSVSAKKKTNSAPPKVSGYELVSNPSAAFGKTIQISGTVSEILYKGNSIRFVVYFSGKPVALDSDSPSLISNVQVGSNVSVCGFYLKDRELKANGVPTTMPFILVDSPDCR